MKSIFTGLMLMVLAGMATAQNFVSTTPSNKNVLLETIGGVNCYYCAEADFSAKSLLTQHSNRLVWVNIHAGIFAEPAGNDPDYRSSYANSLYNLSGISTYPAAMLNRRLFATLAQSNGEYAIARGNWAAATDSVLAESSPVNVAAKTELNISTRQLKVVVETYYTANASGNGNRLFVALLQDSLLGPQEGGSVLNPTAVNSLGQYTHRFLFQDYISSATGLAIATTTSGTFRADTFYYNLPADFNGTAFDVLNPKVAVWIATSDTTEVLTAAYSEMMLRSNDALAANIETLNWDADFNTICGNEATPTLSIKNTGNTAIDSVQINYDINSGSATGTYSYQFPTAITTGRSATFALPTIGGLTQSINTISFSLAKINANNNPNIVQVSDNINHASLYVSDTTNGVFLIRFDNYPEDVSWSLRDETQGLTILADSSYGVGNTTIRQNFTAVEGHCYSLKVNDAYGDGVCCGFGQGYYSLSIGSLQLIRADAFGYESGLKFTFEEGTIAVNLTEKQPFECSIFPNPANSEATLRIESSIVGEAELSVTNAFGQLLSSNFVNLNEGLQYINVPVAALSSGIYFVTLRKGSKMSNVKLSIAK